MHPEANILPSFLKKQTPESKILKSAMYDTSASILH